MADITKCSNQNCPIRHTCWRFLAPTSAVQSFAEFRPKWEDGVGYWCEMYVEEGYAQCGV